MFVLLYGWAVVLIQCDWIGPSPSSGFAYVHYEVLQSTSCFSLSLSASAGAACCVATLDSFLWRTRAGA